MLTPNGTVKFVIFFNGKVVSAERDYIAANYHRMYPNRVVYFLLFLCTRR